MDRRAFLQRLAPVAEPPPPPPRVSTGLEPFVPSADAPWDQRRAAHLVRRTAFGVTLPDLAGKLAQAPGDAVAALVQAALDRPLPDAPSWYDSMPSGNQNVEWTYEWQEGWYREMRAGGLREKMALFWHNHFVTEANTYGLAPYAYQYLTLLRAHALGNFRTLLDEVGRLPAMLLYLDGASNEAGNPNENYARELFELFTMAVGNYTQEDIEETARALTGWRVSESSLSSFFDPDRHDDGQKTIFGEAGTWGYDDVLDLVFQERREETARRICTKLYQAFVYAAPNEAVVDGLVAQLLADDFEVAPTLQLLLSSAHFFDEAFIGARIKSPTELLVGLVREASIEPTDAVWSSFRELGFVLGQELLNPPNVAGWPGYRTWVTTGTAPERKEVARQSLYGGAGFEEFDPLPLVEQITDHTNVYAVVEDVPAFLLAAELPQEDADYLLELLLAGAPYYEWPALVATTPETARERLRAALDHLYSLPEYQLT